MKINYTAAAMAALTAGALLLFFRKGMKESKTYGMYVKNGERGRGYSNNNPLNLDYSDKNNWLNKVPKQYNTDPRFEQFYVSMAYGFRAAMINIRTYINEYGRRTVQSIIYRWAPASDGNDPAKYTSDVCKITGMLPGTIISPTNKQQMCALVRAMAFIENGYYVTNIDQYINEAWNLYL